MPSLNQQILRLLPLTLPPLAEQQAIAGVLSSLDDKIDLLHRQNQTLEALAQTLFRHWFVDDNFEGRIYDIIQVQSGFAFKSETFQTSGVHGVLKIKNISDGVVDINNTDYISVDIAKAINEKYRVCSGDILFGMTGAEIGKMGIVPQTHKSLWLNQRVAVLKSKYPGAKFLAYLLLASDYGQEYINNAATGSAQPNISAADIENCNFPKLTRAQIHEHCSLLIPLYQKMVFNLGQTQTLETLRNTLLPQLMSGEIRVRL